MEHKEVLPAIEVLMHHAGKSFKEACDELGVNSNELRRDLDDAVVGELYPSERLR